MNSPMVAVAAAASVGSPVPLAAVSDQCGFIPTVAEGPRIDSPPASVLGIEDDIMRAEAVASWTLEQILSGGHGTFVFHADFGIPGSVRSFSIADDGRGSILGGEAIGGQEWELTQPGAAGFSLDRIGSANGTLQLLRLVRDAEGQWGYETVPTGEFIYDGVAMDVRADFEGSAVENFSSEQRDLSAQVWCLLVSKTIVDAVGIDRLRSDWGRMDWARDAANEPVLDEHNNQIPVYGFDPKLSKARDAGEDVARQVMCSLLESGGVTEDLPTGC